MPNTDDLLQTKITGWHTRINSVCKPVVAFLHRFNDGGGVNTGARLKGILTEDWVVAWQRDLDVFVGFASVGVEKGKVVVNDAHEFEIHKRLVQWSVACPFAHAKSRPVDDIGSCFKSGYVVGDAETSVLVAVPIDFEIPSLVPPVLNDCLLYTSDAADEV